MATADVLPLHNFGVVFAMYGMTEEAKGAFQMAHQRAKDNTKLAYLVPTLQLEHDFVAAERNDLMNKLFTEMQSLIANNEDKTTTTPFAIPPPGSPPGTAASLQRKLLPYVSGDLAVGRMSTMAQRARQLVAEGKLTLPSGVQDVPASFMKCLYSLLPH